MYVVQSGRVRLFRRLGHADVAIALLGQGEVFGEMAVLEGLPRTASAVAADASVVVEVTKPQFEQMVRDNGEVALRILRKLSARLREADRQINTFLTAGSVSRTVELLAPAGGRQRRHLASAALDFDAATLGDAGGGFSAGGPDMEPSFRRARDPARRRGCQVTLASDADWTTTSTIWSCESITIRCRSRSWRG